MPVALEVTQEWGDAVLESRQFVEGDVVIGSSSGTRWHFLGVDMGFVPAPLGVALSWFAPMWSDVERTYRPDLLVPSSELPDERDWTLYTTVDGVRTARVAPGWTADAELGERRFDLAGLLEAGLASRDEEGTVRVPMVSGLSLRVHAGGQVFTARMAPRPARLAVRPEPDHAFLAIALPGSLAFVGLALLASILTPLRSETTPVDADELGVRVVDLLAPPPPARRVADGGTPARGPEGPKTHKRGPPKTDKQAASQAGILSVGNLDDLLGSALPNGLAAAIGTLTGPNGHGIGGGGLGDRGDGWAGGGDADGFDGPIGTGRGHSGHGCCGGDLAGKREGAIGTVGGDPIVVGALDRSLVDEVIKRNMNQIRYCYQRELQKRPELEGKVVMKFTISPDGSVSAATVRSSSLGSAEVEGCLAGRFLRMQFPEPKGGGIVVVSYPFLFGQG